MDGHTGQLNLELRAQIQQIAAGLHREFVGTFSVETIERLAHDSIQRLTATARYTSFVPVLAERFTRERLNAAAKTQGHRMTETPTVLYLCVHNAGRSQMAAGWTRHLGGDRVEVLSGGSNPGEQIHPVAAEAMAEVGIDITNDYPKPWTDETLGAADVIVTMGCGDACPVVPGKRYLDWELDDPAGKPLEDVRPIRDEIEQRVRNLLDELGVEPTAA
ncbi:MAG: arsenate reductase ArsC [Actinobacteria bacterium]|nr:arsenate reductase ArsC [Actinomycetota bacterium]